MSKPFGYFEGEVVAKWLIEPGVDDRTMELTERFAYVDPSGARWEAPIGSRINGASIPPGLWSMAGAPYVGNYRRASVVHDVACDDELASSDEAHKMFYYAMLCDGVDAVKAVAMYKAVKKFGPQWKSRDTKMSATFSPQAGARDADLEADFARLLQAAASAVDELGKNAPLEDLDQRIDKNLAD